MKEQRSRFVWQVQHSPTPFAPESLLRPQNMTADMEPPPHPERRERRATEAETWTAELAGTTVEMIRDDWRLRYDRSTPTRRERGAD